MRSSDLGFPSLIVDGRARKAIVRTAYFRLSAVRKRPSAWRLRSTPSRVWPIFVFAAVFGVVSALITKPAHHEARRSLATESRHSG
jgi:hypothetical protein